MSPSWSFFLVARADFKNFFLLWMYSEDTALFPGEVGAPRSNIYLSEEDMSSGVDAQKVLPKRI